MRLDEDSVHLDVHWTHINQTNQHFPALVQCNKCGMPFCRSCSSKLDTITTENTTNSSETDKFLVPYLHTHECQILQNAGLKNIPINNVKDVRKLYAILTPLRLLLEARKSPGLLDLEVITNIA